MNHSGGPEVAEVQAQENVRAQDNPPQGDDQSQQGEDRIQEALETAADIAEETGGLGIPGRPVNRRSPFMIGLAGAFGVAVTYGLVELFIRARAVLIIIGLAMFIAAGLDPVVGWLVRHRFPRWAAVLTVIIAGAAIVGGFLAAAIPPMASEGTALAHQIPSYMHSLQDKNSELGQLNTKFHIQQRLTTLVTSGGSALVGGVLGAGEVVLLGAQTDQCVAATVKGALGRGLKVTVAWPLPAVAVPMTGAPGTVAGTTALESPEAQLVPTALVAVTLNL